jgi:hypothetical protein
MRRYLREETEPSYKTTGPCLYARASAEPPRRPDARTPTGSVVRAGASSEPAPHRWPDAQSPRYVLSNLGVLENPTRLNGREGAKGRGGTLCQRLGDSGLVAPFWRVGAALLALVDAGQNTVGLNKCADPLPGFWRRSIWGFASCSNGRTK